MEENCPNCGTELNHTPVYHWGALGHKVIGSQAFCPKEGCNYQGKISSEIIEKNNGITKE